jgi:hypothetical protein
MVLSYLRHINVSTIKRIACLNGISQAGMCGWHKKYVYNYVSVKAMIPGLESKRNIFCKKGRS